MEVNGSAKDIIARLRELKVKPHTKLVVNGKPRVWYSCKLNGVDAYNKFMVRLGKYPVEAKIVASSKMYDKDNNLFFDLVREDIIGLRRVQHDYCAFCGEKMQTQKRKRRNGLTIDRLDSTKGHTRENCVLSCWDCNCGCNITRTVQKMKRCPQLVQYLKKTIAAIEAKM
jgi:hypothetical protein